MKDTATIILNRNLPAVTDKLYELIQRHDGDITDIYVVESGSQENNLSKYCSWWACWEESLDQGLRYPRGFNFALSKLLEESKYDKYKYFFLVCNDAEFTDAPMLSPLVELMESHPRLGILSPCSKGWGERSLLDSSPMKFFWYINHIAWLVRREYVDSVRELENPDYMNFLYDGTNFRGYESDMELIAKGYINDWAAGITTRVFAEENKQWLVTKHQLIRTEPVEESLQKCLEEGRRWMRRKYGFNSRWSMQMYTKYFYDQYFVYFPEDVPYRI